MDLRRFGLLQAAIVMLGLLAAWLFPWSISNVDPFIMLIPVMLAVLGYSAYLSAMAHKGGFAVNWPSGHSATAHGGWAFNIPARGNYPELVAAPLGGGNVIGLIAPGGGRHGWMIAPKDQVYECNGQLTCTTNLIEHEPQELPPHVLARLKQERLYSKRGQVAFGLLPHREMISKISEEDMITNQDKIVLELKRTNKAYNDIDEAYHQAMDLINMQSKQIRRFAIKYQEQDQVPTIKEKFIGREDDQ